MLLQIVKELEAKNHFLYIDKSHNYDGNLPIKAAKRDIVTQMHMQNLYKFLI